MSKLVKIQWGGKSMILIFKPPQVVSQSSEILMMVVIDAS